MAARKFDLFALQFATAGTGLGPTQLTGPQQLTIRHGRRSIRSEADGTTVIAAEDQGPFFGEGSLVVGDVSTLMAVLAAFEGAAGFQRAILAEGREVGAGTVTDILVKRAVLTAARLSVENGRYASVNFDFRVSCDPASDTQDDEVSFTPAQAKTATIGAGKRVYRVVSAVHGGVVQAEAAAGLELNIAARSVQAVHGDGDFGETVDVANFEVGGRVRFRDYTVAGLLAKAQALIAATVGALVVTMTQQGGGTTTLLTLANTRFFEASDTFRQGDYWMCDLSFGCEGVSGVTPYGLASGGNKVITMA